MRKKKLKSFLKFQLDNLIICIFSHIKKRLLINFSRQNLIVRNSYLLRAKKQTYHLLLVSFKEIISKTNISLHHLLLDFFKGTINYCFSTYITHVIPKLWMSYYWFWLCWKVYQNRQLVFLYQMYPPLIHMVNDFTEIFNNIMKQISNILFVF